MAPVELPGLQKRQEPTAAERVAGLAIKSIQDWLILLDKREIPSGAETEFLRGYYAGMRAARFEGSVFCASLQYALVKEANDL